MVALQNLVADAEDFTTALEAPGGWSVVIDPVAAGFTSSEESEPDWKSEWYNDGAYPYDPNANNLSCWFKFTVPPGEGRAFRISTEGSHYTPVGGYTAMDTTVFVFTYEDPPDVLFEDTFTRTVASGLGGTYTDDPNGWSEVPVSVDGAKAIAGGADYGAAVVRNTSIPHPSQFDLLFDFSTGAIGTSPTYLWVGLGKLYVEIFPSNTTADPLLYYVSVGRATSETTSFKVTEWQDQSFDANSTYRARVRQDGNSAFLRFTKIGDAESADWFGTWDLTGAYDAPFWMDFESANDGDIQTLDNLKVQTLSSPWFDWASMPPYPGNGRCLMYEDDYEGWQSLPRPPGRNTYISPETYAEDAGFEGNAPLFTEGTYLVNISSYMFYDPNPPYEMLPWQTGQGEYVIEASLTPWEPPDAPAIFLSNNWREAIDMVPVLPKNSTDNNGVQYTGIVSVASYDTDTGDPFLAVPGVTELPGTIRGYRTGWLKAVLPRSGVLSLDFTGTNYKHALLVYRYDSTLDDLVLVDTDIPYAIGTSKEAFLVPHVMNGMLAGQTTAATGIPGVTHNDLMWRAYSLAEVYVPGPSKGWSNTPDGAWYGVGAYPDTIYIDVSVYISMWNVGYAKSATLKVQYMSNGAWYDVPGVTHSTGALNDSRYGNAHLWHQTYGPITLNFSTGRFRLVAEENTWGSEIWTNRRNLTVRGYFRPRALSDEVVVGNALKYANRFDAGTYLFCLTQYENDPARTTASVTVSLTHPRL